MQTWIALLRGINVGGRNILPMKEWVCDLESLDLTNIRTYIQSGNAVFQSSGKGSAKAGARIGTRIAARIESGHGFCPQVLILSVDELIAAIESNPFPAAECEPTSLHFLFLAATPRVPNLEALVRAQSGSESFRLTDHVFYLHAPDGIGRSRLAAKAEKWLGVTTTGRNFRTVQRLREMSEDYR